MFCLTAHFSLTPRSAKYFTSNAKESQAAAVALIYSDKRADILVEVVRAGEFLLIFNFT